MTYTIKTLTINDEARWDDYVSNKDCSVYHLCGWRKLIQDEFDHSNIYLFAENDGGEITGILPIIRQKSFLFGDNFISLPYFNYGGPVANSEEIEQALLNEASKFANKLKVKNIEYREKKLRESLSGSRDTKVTMILDLPETEDILWNKLNTKRRTRIRRAAKENVEILSGKSELLDDFYKVFSQNMRDLGTPVYPVSFFKAIVALFPNLTTVYVVKLNGEPVGAAFVITYNQIAEIPWASTKREYNKYGINMYMYWEILRDVISKGNSKFDFGRCSINSGTYDFKKQWGAIPEQLYWNYWLPDGVKMPEINPDNPKYDLAIKLWKKLPLSVANTIGPLISRNLP